MNVLEFQAINQKPKKAYVFQEYPKWVNGKIVQSREEEESQSEDSDEREQLMVKGRELGLRIHPAISTEKLREKIKAAQE